MDVDTTIGQSACHSRAETRADSGDYLLYFRQSLIPGSFVGVN